MSQKSHQKNDAVLDTLSDLETPLIWLLKSDP